MLRGIKIGDKDVTLLANGATPVRYRQLFHKDLISRMNDSQSADDISDMASELCFIMAKAAEKVDMNALTVEMYYDWLEQFETLDLINASEDIFTTYVGQNVTTSTAKKKQNAKQSGK